MNLRAVGENRFPKLLTWMAEQTRVNVDPAVLAKYGTDLTALAERGTLPRAHGMDDLYDTLQDMLRREPARSLVLLGDAGTGKIALINELACRLRLPEHGEWCVCPSHA